MQPLSTNAIKPIAGTNQLWRADELAASRGRTVPTGSRELDAQLPGGGWPVGALIEVLQAHTGHNDWRLLLPALVKTQSVLDDGPNDVLGGALGGVLGGVLVLVGAPYAPFAPGLAGQGLDPARLLCVNTAAPAARMWAAEQALRCKDVAAVLAWLPQARADSLRRLQISAVEHHKLLFVMRPAQAQHESSPAVLRLMTSSPPESDALMVNILKRRGPPLEQALTWAARPARLGALLALGKKGSKAGVAGATGAAAGQAGGLGGLGRLGGAGQAGEAEIGVRARSTESCASLRLPVIAIRPQVSASPACPTSPACPAAPAELLHFPPQPQEPGHALDRAAA